MTQTTLSREVVKRLLTVLTAGALSLLLAEGICWIVLDPVDFLKPTKIMDPILGIRLEPNSAGHDSLGYRNKSVPSQAAIVAIGDSQTYGISATATHSWPSQLEAITQKRVYNLALGGYGPIQYGHLAEHYALAFKPKQIIVGFYLGNDLREAYALVYQQDYWRHLRQSNFQEVGTRAPSHEKPRKVARKKLFGDTRDWLARRSILYRMTTHSVFGNLARRIEAKSATPNNAEEIVLDIPERGIFTVLTPKLRLATLDQRSPLIREGLRLSLEAMSGIGSLCKKHGVQLLVALIPTKESVYSVHAKHIPAARHSTPFKDLVAHESKVNEILRDHLKQNGIQYLDLLLPLQKSALNQHIYPDNYDGHPNRLGYKVIADNISRRLTMD